MNDKHYAAIWSALSAFLLLYAINAHSRSQGGPSMGDLFLLDERPIILSFYATIFISLGIVALAGVGISYAREASGKKWTARLPSLGLEGDNNPFDHTKRSTSIYKAILLIAFVLLPLTSAVHSALKVYKYGFVYAIVDCNENPNHHQCLSRKSPTDECGKSHCTNPFGVPLKETLPLEQSSEFRVLINNLPPNREHYEFRLAASPSDAARSLGIVSAAIERDYSKACYDNIRLCSGIDWFPFWSPFLMFILVLSAMCACLAYFIVIFRRIPNRG